VVVCERNADAFRAEVTDAIYPIYYRLLLSGLKWELCRGRGKRSVMASAAGDAVSGVHGIMGLEGRAEGGT